MSSTLRREALILSFLFISHKLFSSLTFDVSVEAELLGLGVLLTLIIPIATFRPVDGAFEPAMITLSVERLELRNLF